MKCCIVFVIFQVVRFVCENRRFSSLVNICYVNAVAYHVSNYQEEKCILVCQINYLCLVSLWRRKSIFAPHMEIQVLLFF